ncbi:MAG: hypothetical protein J3K34DRAFT_402547 [Monoraphidium minutum]|nr:MAG: hypothetical protein J3K34DRAFT_402547 [Monoraphidium minutum]
MKGSAALPFHEWGMAAASTAPAGLPTPQERASRALWRRPPARPARAGRGGVGGATDVPLEGACMGSEIAVASQANRGASAVRCVWRLLRAEIQWPQQRAGARAHTAPARAAATAMGGMGASSRMAQRSRLDRLDWGRSGAGVAKPRAWGTEVGSESDGPG